MEDLMREQAEALRSDFLENLPPLLKAAGSIGVKLCMLPEEAPATFGLKVYMIVSYSNSPEGQEERIRRRVPENLQDNLVVEISSERALLASAH